MYVVLCLGKSSSSLPFLFSFPPWLLSVALVELLVPWLRAALLVVSAMVVVLVLLVWPAAAGDTADLRGVLQPSLWMRVSLTMILSFTSAVVFAIGFLFLLP